MEPESAHDERLRLIGLIQDAVGNAARWQEFLHACRDHVSALAASFMIRDLEQTEFSMACVSGWSHDDAKVYERYRLSDPINRYAALQPEGAVHADPEFCPREIWEASAAYREYYAPRDRIHGFCGMILCTPTAQSAITFSRGKQAGRFGETECAKVRALLPHLRRAALLHVELESLRALNAALTGHLNRSPCAVCLLDRERRPLYSNAAASTLLSRRDGIRTEAGRLTTESPGEEDALHAAFTSTLTRRKVGRASITRPASDQGPWRFVLLPIPVSGSFTFGAAQRFLRSADGAPAACTASTLAG